MATVSVPPFINHNAGVILSIDSHPGGQKFITSGQKANTSSGLVVVWNVEPILDPAKASNENVPKMLFQVESQSSSNSCRWSPDGRRFAFGSDDSSVSVWEYVGRINSAGSITGGAGCVERYKESCILRGHSMEVLSVEWSPNGKFLATSSLDHKILIYNSKKLPDRIATLSGSEAAVKGLAWDPIGKYLASIEGDKRLRLWTTDSWQCVQTITEPFEESKEETMLTRLDWSPDGKYLLTPAAVKDGQSLIKLISRQGWKSDLFLAGPRKGTTCVRSMPRLTNLTLKNGKRMQSAFVAVGSRDKSISVWNFPGAVKPLFVIENLFHHSVMDFAWCGRNLLACSQDGSVKVISFDETLLGDVMSNENMSDVCYQMYSIRPPQYESAQGLEEEKGDGDSSLVSQEINSTLIGGGANSSFLTCPEEVLNRRKKQDPMTIKPATVATVATEIQQKSKENIAKISTEKAMMEERNKQTETRKDGKRRIQPIFIGTTSAEGGASEAPTTSATTSSEVAKKAFSMAPPPSKKKAPVDRDEIDLEDSSNSEDDDDEEEEEEDVETSSEADDVRNRKRKHVAPTTNRPILAMDFKKPVLRAMEPKSLQTKEGTVLMEAPEQQPTISQIVMERKTMLVEVDNRWKHGGVETTQVKLVKKRQEDPAATGEEEGFERRVAQETIWMAVLAAPVIIVAANKNYVILGCGDKCLRAYRTLCGSLVASLRLDSLPVLVGVKDHAAYALTEYGRLSTWNLKTLKAVVSRQPLFDCVEATSSENSLISVDVSESGVPLIVFSNGSIFTFNVSLSCWIQAITTNVIGRLTSPISDAQLGFDGVSAGASGPLARLLKRMRKQTMSSGVAPQVSKAVKESQLEQLLHCAEQLGNPQDYQTMLNLYVETLCEGGSEKKLKNIVNELSRSGAPMTLCGLRRSALCDDVTRILKLRQPAIAERIVGGAAANVKTRSLF